MALKQISKSSCTQLEDIVVWVSVLRLLIVFMFARSKFFQFWKKDHWMDILVTR